MLILSKELPPTVGGAGIVAHTIYRSLQRKGIDVDISAISHPNKYINLFITLKYILQSFAFKSIILNDLYFKKVWLTLFRGYLSGNAIVYLHGSEPEFLMNNSAYKKRFLRLCSNSKSVVAVSSYMKQKFLASIDTESIKKKLEGKIRIISNGIDTDIFNYKGRDFASSPLIIVSAGRLVREKGFYTKADLIKELIEVHKLNVRWHIAGTGPDSGLIKKYIEDCHLIPYVTFHGALNQSKLANLYNQSHVFLLLSELKESLGLVYMEASCCGCYSIGLNRYGVKEAIVDNKTGNLVDNTSNAIKLILDRNHSPTSISSYATKHFSSDIMYKKLKALF